MNVKDLAIVSARKKFQKELNDYSIEDMYNYHLTIDTTKRYFVANSIDSYYYSLDESLDILERLLAWQYDADIKKIEKFLQLLADILDKKTKKLNTVYCYGPSCSGKTKNRCVRSWLWSCITSKTR